MELESYMTPDSASSYDSCDSLSTLSSNNSDASRSPDHAMGGRCEHQAESNNDSFCKMCLSSLRSSLGKHVFSCSCNKSVSKADDETCGNIVDNSDSTTDSVSSGSSTEKNSKTSFHLPENASSEDENSNKSIRKKQKRNSSSSNSKEFDSNPVKGEADPKTPDYADPYSRQLAEKHSAVSDSPTSKLCESDEAFYCKASNSDDLIFEDMDKSSMEEGDRVNS